MHRKKSADATGTAGKSLFVSALCVAVAVILLGYSAYGWMSMNNKVRAIGQNVTVTVPENLHIATVESGPWSETVSIDMNKVVQNLVETKPFYEHWEDQFYLLPASSYNGRDLWYTSKASILGNAPVGTVFEPAHPIQWNASTSAFEGHYVDVPLFFRSDWDREMVVVLNGAKTRITPEGSNIIRVVRVGFLNADGSASSMGEAEPPLILADENRDLFDGVIISGEVEKKAPRYLTFSGGLSEPLFIIPPGEVKAITVRIWVEGQDKSCVADIGGQNFSVSLVFCAEDS